MQGSQLFGVLASVCLFFGASGQWKALAAADVAADCCPEASPVCINIDAYLCTVFTQCSCACKRLLSPATMKPPVAPNGDCCPEATYDCYALNSFICSPDLPYARKCPCTCSTLLGNAPPRKARPPPPSPKPRPPSPKPKPPTPPSPKPSPKPPSPPSPKPKPPTPPSPKPKPPSPPSPKPKPPSPPSPRPPPPKPKPSPPRPRQVCPLCFVVSRSNGTFNKTTICGTAPKLVQIVSNELRASPPLTLQSCTVLTPSTGFVFCAATSVTPTPSSSLFSSILQQLPLNCAGNAFVQVNFRCNNDVLASNFGVGQPCSGR